MPLSLRTRDGTCTHAALRGLTERDPLAEVLWDAARDAVGMEVAVIVEETGKVLVGWTRDAVHAQREEFMRQSAKVLGPGARDVIAAGAGPP